MREGGHQTKPGQLNVGTVVTRCRHRGFESLPCALRKIETQQQTASLSVGLRNAGTALDRRRVPLECLAEPPPRLFEQAGCDVDPGRPRIQAAPLPACG